MGAEEDRLIEFIARMWLQDVVIETKQKGNQ